MKNIKITVLSTFCGIIIGAAASIVSISKLVNRIINKTPNETNKYFELFMMMNQWVNLKQDNKNIASYLNAHGYHKIAIYGMSHVGLTLLNELNGTEVQVAYGIDQNAQNVYADIEVVSMQSHLESVDAVVVTPIHYFDEIKDTLSLKMQCPIISLSDIVGEL